MRRNKLLLWWPTLTAESFISSGSLLLYVERDYMAGDDDENIEEALKLCLRFDCGDKSSFGEYEDTLRVILSLQEGFTSILWVSRHQRLR